MMLGSDGPKGQDGMSRIRACLSAVNATPPRTPQGADAQGTRADGRSCTGPFSCRVIEAAIPAIPKGLDDQGVLIAQYMRDLVCALLDGMQSQIAHLECAVLAARLNNQPYAEMQAVEAGVHDSEVAPDIRIGFAHDVLHQAVPSDSKAPMDGAAILTTGETMQLVCSDKCEPTDRTFNDELRASNVEFTERPSSTPSIAEIGTNSAQLQIFGTKSSQLTTSRTRSGKIGLAKSTKSGSYFFETTRRDIETHQVMKLRARIRAGFTSSGKPLMLSPSKLSSVLQRRGIAETYTLPILEKVLRAMSEVIPVALRDEERASRGSTGSWMDAIQKSRMVATLTVSQRPDDPIGRLPGSIHGIVDLDIFIKLLLNSDLVRIVNAHTDSLEIGECIKHIQQVLLEKEAIHDIIDRLALAEASDTPSLAFTTYSYDKARTCRSSDWIEFFTVLVYLITFVLEVDSEQDWAGWDVIEVSCTSVLTLLIAWKISTESLRSYLCGERWMWNLTDIFCTAGAICAFLGRTATGRLYSLKLTMAIRLLRALHMQRFLYMIPVFREVAVMFAGLVIGLPYLISAVVLMLFLTLITGVATKVTVGPSVGQDLTSRCGTGDDYYRSGGSSEECLLVFLYSEEFLDSVANSVITTFRCMTGSCTSKEGFSLDLIFFEYYGAGFVYAYIVVTCTFIFGIANVLTAVFTDAIHRDLQTRFKHFAPPKQDVHGKLMDLKELVREIVQVADNDLPLNLTRNELDNIMKDVRVLSILHDLGVCFDNGAPAFELFDFDCDEYVRESDLYFMILKMRGPLHKADVVGTWLSLRDQRDANNVNHLAILDAQQNIYRQLQCRKSAVMLYRVDKAFEDEISTCCGDICIVSFPGRHVFEWQGLVQLCKEGRLNSACVYLPKDDPKKRYGVHSNNPATPGTCYCWSLYGGPQEWGCKWFSAWTKQVRKAVDLRMELVVVFFEGQKDCGVQDWKDLACADLWDNVGLGGSQKGEVAWLQQQGYQFTSMDLREANDYFQLNASRVTRVSQNSQWRPVSTRKSCGTGIDQESPRFNELGTAWENWPPQVDEPVLAVPHHAN